MAAPTATTVYTPDLIISVTGTNVDAGNNDYTLTYRQAKLTNGFSIVTGTLTAMTVTVLAANGDATLVDMTNDFFGVAALASSTGYLADVPTAFSKIVIRAARTNATNAVNFTAFGGKG